jgi:hypothetical protein
VLRAFIRLERHAETDDFLEFGPGVVGCTGALQMAVALWKIGAVAPEAIGRVASELAQRGMKPEVLTMRLHDLCRRAIATAEEISQIGDNLLHAELIAPLGALPEPDPRWMSVWQRDPHRVWTPPQYVGE